MDDGTTIVVAFAYANITSHSSVACCCYLIIGNKACVYNHTLLLWKMGHVNKAIKGWVWYRELAITTHEQCQQTSQQLKNRYVTTQVHKPCMFVSEVCRFQHV